MNPIERRVEVVKICKSRKIKHKVLKTASVKENNIQTSSQTTCQLSKKRSIAKKTDNETESESRSESSELDVNYLAEVLDQQTFTSVANLLDLQVPPKVNDNFAVDFLSDHVGIRSKYDSKEVCFSKIRQKNATDETKKTKVDSRCDWRAVAKVTPISSTSLEDRAEEVSKEVATEFIKWFESLGHSSERITVQYLMDMFQINPSECGETCIRVEYQRLANLPQPHLLMQEVMKDKKYVKKKPRMVAFGKTLPPELRVVPIRKTDYPKLLTGVPPSRIYLASMAHAFEGITHLKSTRSFAEYLSKVRNDVTIPTYFIECGMITKHGQCSSKFSSNKF